MPYTNQQQWESMSDAERFARVQLLQRVSSALGPTERRVSTPLEWARLDDRQRRALLLQEEHEAANRRQASSAFVLRPTNPPLQPAEAV